MICDITYIRWAWEESRDVFSIRGGAKVAGKGPDADEDDTEGGVATSKGKKGKSSKSKKKGNNKKDLLDLSKDKKDVATAILNKKTNANTVLVDDSISDDAMDHSTVSLSAKKMEELSLFNGDTVLLKGRGYSTTSTSHQ